MSASRAQQIARVWVCRAGEPLLAPQEILVQILTLKKEACPVKQHIAALTACLTMKLPDGSMAFPSQSLASTLQQLVVRSALQTGMTPLLYCYPEGSMGKSWPSSCLNAAHLPF